MIFPTLMSKQLRKGKEVNTLTETDISDAEVIVKIMSPVKVVTTILCEEDQPTISMTALLKAKLKGHFAVSDEDSAEEGIKQ